MRDRLDEMRFRDKLVDVPHEEYHQMVLDCGVHEGHELEDVTRRLHEGLQIRYYGAGKAAMGGRVFLDVFWCSGVSFIPVNVERFMLLLLTQMVSCLDRRCVPGANSPGQDSLNEILRRVVPWGQAGLDQACMGEKNLSPRLHQ